MAKKKKKTAKDDGADNTAQVNKTARKSESAESNCARLRSPMSVIDGCASVRNRQIRISMFSWVVLELSFSVIAYSDFLVLFKFPLFFSSDGGADGLIN